MISLTRERRIDWARVVADLKSRDMPPQEIADALGVCRSSVQGYCDEDLCTEPAFWVGSALLVLWSKRMGLSYTEAPMRNVQLSVSAVLRSID